MQLIIRIFLFLLVFTSINAFSQDTAIDVTNLQGYWKVIRHLKVYQPASDDENINNVPLTAYKNNQPTGVRENNYYQSRWYLLKVVYKGEDSSKVIYFYPGKMVNTRVFVFDSALNNWQYIPERKAFNAISLSSKIALIPLKLQRGKTNYFLFQPELHYYNWTQFKPTITDHSSINDLILQEFIRPNYTNSILTILMTGMMLMLFSYSFLKFYLNRRSEYLYNSLFGLAFVLFFAVLFVNNYYYQAWWHKSSGFFQKWLQILGYIFEIIFIIRFLDLRNKQYRLFTLLKTTITGMMVYCCVLPFISFSDTLFSFNTLSFDAVTVLLLLIALYTSIVLQRWNKHLSRYVAFGMFSLMGFLTLIILQNTLLREKQYLVQKIGGWAILYQLGIVANLFFFRLGLGQKERKEELKNLDDIEKLKLENEKKELEKVLAIASSRVDERNRIAKEIHDDIGSGLTSIRLLSEIALVKKENKDELNKISANANELVNNLNEIIWSINSKNDTIPNLLAYIRSHMVDYLESYDIKLSINIPSNIPNIEISGEKRRNIFMVIKECFTNIVKHANASAVNLTVQVRDQLIFTIKDNGKGFESNDILPFKNGIRNMKERMEHVGGELDIWSNNGTTITIKVPFNGNNPNL